MKLFWFVALGAVPTALSQVFVIQVGSANGDLTFSPSSVSADVGSFVQFQFNPVNHSVVSANFDAPCVPATTGAQFFSGFLPVAADSTALPTFTIQVNDTAPIWLYCSQAQHCQNGMVGVINEDATSANNLATFKAKAALAPDNITPGQISSESSSTTSSSPASTTVSGSGTVSASASGTSKPSDPPSSSTPSSKETSARSTPSTGNPSIASPSTGSPTSGSSSAPTSSTPDKKNGGISTATAIGIGVGVTIGAVAMVSGAIVLWWRLRRRRNANRNSNLTSFQQPHVKPELDDTQMYITRSEMEGSRRQAPPRPKRYTIRSLYAGQKFELDSRRDH